MKKSKSSRLRSKLLKKHHHPNRPLLIYSPPALRAFLEQGLPKKKPERKQTKHTTHRNISLLICSKSSIPIQTCSVFNSTFWDNIGAWKRRMVHQRREYLRDSHLCPISLSGKPSFLCLISSFKPPFLYLQGDIDKIPLSSDLMAVFEKESKVQFLAVKVMERRKQKNSPIEMDCGQICRRELTRLFKSKWRYLVCRSRCWPWPWTGTNTPYFENLLVFTVPQSLIDSSNLKSFSSFLPSFFFLSFLFLFQSLEPTIFVVDVWTTSRIFWRFSTRCGYNGFCPAFWFLPCLIWRCWKVHGKKWHSNI